MTKPFHDLPLAPALLRAIDDMGYATMTPIQEQAIPVVMAGQDIMGAAQTGTGKTAAFALPLLQRLLKHENHSVSPARHPVRALVLLPTRELAVQVADQVKLFAKHTALRSAVVFGGMDIKPQVAQLREGVEVLVATPGRLLDHIEAKTAALHQVEYVVLDEADRMLDIGFLPDLQRILSYLPKQRTTLLFSATFSGDIRKLANSYLSNPVTVEVAQANATAATVKQRFISVSDDDKRRALVQLVREQAEVAGQAFVFVNSKLGCARLARALERDGLQATALHGDKSQDERLRALQAFKAGQVQLLVCTDVAARGLDIKDVPAVFNFDLPFNPEDYVHRIGRTGRAGAEGLAISFVSGNNARQLADIEKLIRLKAELEPMEWSDDRPPRGRHFNDGQRVWRERIERSGEQGERPRRHEAPAATPKAPYDPLFDKPYEPAAEAHTPAWDAKAPVAKPRGVSAYIRSRKKVAALFNKPAPAAPREQPAVLPVEPSGAASEAGPGGAEAAAQPSTETSGTSH